jgi:hypothetical protein
MAVTSLKKQSAINSHQNRCKCFLSPHSSSPSLHLLHFQYQQEILLQVHTGISLIFLTIIEVAFVLTDINITEWVLVILVVHIHD